MAEGIPSSASMDHAFDSSMIFTMAAIGLAYVDLQGRWLDVNPKVCEITGYSREELQQLTFQELTHPDDLEADLALLTRLLKGEIATYSLEKRYLRKDGSAIWINLTVALVRREEPAQSYYIATIEDIQQRKQVEEERRRLLAREAKARKQLERVNEELRVLQAITDTALAHLSVDSLFQTVLSRIRAIMGADNIAVLLLDERERVLRVRAVQGIEEGIAPHVRIPLGEGFAGRIAAQCSPLVVHDNIPVAPINPVLRSQVRSLMGVPLVVGGRVLGVVHVGMKSLREFTEQDIQLFQRVADRLAMATERSLLYEEATRAEQALREQAHVQQNFLATVSHEFRTALTSIQGFSDLLRNHAVGAEEVREFAAYINTDALRLLRMINDLLDLERMKEGKSRLLLEPVVIRDLVEMQVERSRVTTNRHTFEVECEEGLPPLEGDRDKLSQALLNLLSNAIKYSPGGGRIRICIQREGEYLHLRIQDQGIGIPAKALDLIFTPYHRVQAEGSRYIQGTGLGLPIVKKIIEMHQGKIWAESAPQQGSTFHLLLPCAQKHGGGQGAAPVQRRRPGAGADNPSLLHDEASVN